MITPGPSVLRLANFVNGSPFKPSDLGDEGLPVIRIRQLLDRGAPIERALPPARPVVINRGDLIFSWSATLAVRHWYGDTALLNQHLFRVDPLPGIERRWLGYVLETGIEHLKPLMHGSAMTHITLNMLRMLSVTVPDLSQQETVADYLDVETGRIDTLISKKRHMIALLRERWIAFAESVLSRFDPLPLKRYVTKIGSGSTPRGGARVYISSGPAFLRSQNVKGGMIDLSDVVFINPAAQKELRRALVQPGDVLLNITGASIGRAAVFDHPGIQAYVSQHVCIVRPAPGVYASLLCAELLSHSIQEQIAVTQVGGNREGLNFEQVGNLLVRVPPSGQSQATAQEVAAGFARSMRAREILGAQIDLLEERRQALITAAVTGQLAIPGVAA